MASENYAQRLIQAVQELSMARSLNAVAEVVRHAARELVGADGATFVLRDGEQCFYKDEDAISPLWKGQRFPLQACISGWAMLNRQAAVIEDIYLDERIPHAVYRPTFVKSLVMVPIRALEPIGALGTYWASQHRATAEQVEMLQALADATSVALEPEFWAVLDRIAAARSLSKAQLLAEIDAGRGRRPLASACRLLALDWVADHGRPA